MMAKCQRSEHSIPARLRTAGLPKAPRFSGSHRSFSPAVRKTEASLLPAALTRSDATASQLVLVDYWINQLTCRLISSSIESVRNEEIQPNPNQPLSLFEDQVFSSVRNPNNIIYFSQASPTFHRLAFFYTDYVHPRADHRLQQPWSPLHSQLIDSILRIIIIIIIICIIIIINIMIIMIRILSLSIVIIILIIIIMKVILHDPCVRPEPSKNVNHRDFFHGKIDDFLSLSLSFPASLPL